MTKRLLILLLFCKISSLAQSAESDQSDLKEIQRVQQEMSVAARGKNYPKSIEIFIAIIEKYPNDLSIAGSAKQMLGTMYSFVGEHNAALKAFDRAPNAQQLDEVVTALEPHNAHDLILKMAEDRQILMINEAHHVPQHRVLTYNLLADLWSKGYRYFAVETLTKDTTALNNSDYVTDSSGFYTREPIFANLILKAKGLGFQLVSYDYGDEGQVNWSQERETTASRHIKEKIFDKDQQAKVIIHVGYSHIDEQTWLASYLKKDLGIDPLTVDQTSTTEKSDPVYESPTYKWAVENLEFNNPIVLLDKSEVAWSSNPNSFDLTVLWPRTRFKNGRPEWAALGRDTILADGKVCNDSLPCMIEVTRYNKDDEIASDRVVLNSTDEKKSIFFSDKDIWLVAKDVNGVELSREKIK